MKKIILLFIVVLTLICCDDKNDPPKAEVDKLPPATQTGANKVGCLLDGKAFMPGYYNNSTNCFYQYTNGGYYFALGFDNRDSKANLTTLLVGARKKQIFEGETYDLLEYTDGNACGMYGYNAYDAVYTSQTHTGELKITKLDEVNGIVSGTFWFDIKDTAGVVHQIREGRFDMHYTN